MSRNPNHNNFIGYVITCFACFFGAVTASLSEYEYNYLLVVPNLVFSIGMGYNAFKYFKKNKK
ncbi:MAG: hypothetical protein CMC19_09025 [Flavobacteriaceae bacterium]|nr:hypothetical protein [Flavobacteriaceae bacterium]